MFSQKGFAVDNWTVITSVVSEHPAYSPDWNWIVYRNTSNGKLYKKSADDTSNWTEITSVNSYYPAYSPDWNWIVYRNTSNGKLYKKSADDTYTWTEITSVDSYYPAYSPDWNWIVYRKDLDGKLYKKSADDTSNWTAITSVASHEPAHSPDWNWIVYRNENDWNKLYKKSADDTSNWTAITSVVSEHPAYSPDWNWIVYKNGDDWNKLYKKFADDTSNWTAITSVVSEHPAYSPDWNWIVYKNGDDWSKLYKITFAIPNTAPTISSATSTVPYINSLNETSVPFIINWITDPDTWNILIYKYSWDWTNWTNLSPTETSPKSNTDYNFNINVSWKDDWDLILRVKASDWTGDSSEKIIAITKNTVLPVIWNINSSEDLVEFACDKDWDYKIEKTSPIVLVLQDWTATTSWTNNLKTFWESDLNTGDNTIKLSCKDDYVNISETSVVINKTEPIPSMSWSVLLFSDNDADWNWISWRDLNISWNTADWEVFSWFESYKVYVLPDWVSLNTWVHIALKTEITASIWTWTWDSTVTLDSVWNAFSSGDYNAFVLIIWNTDQFWTEWFILWTLTSDVITQPSLITASFTTDTNLKLTFDSNLSTTLLDHSIWWITFNVDWNPKTVSSIANISGSDINLTISSLWSTDKTWTDLVVPEWAIKWLNPWFNSWVSGWSIADVQNPLITSFSISTVADYSKASGDDFFTWNIDLNFIFSENMQLSSQTRIEFSREDWESDWSFYFANLDNWLAWVKLKTIDLSWAWLNSWTCYQVRVFWKDIAWNTWTTWYIWDVCWDSQNPEQIILDNYQYPWDWNDPLFTWTAWLDNSIFESLVKDYQFQISTSTWFLTTEIDTTISTNSYTFTWVTVLWQDYYWRVRSTDNLNQIWLWSDYKIFDINAPVISNWSIIPSWDTLIPMQRPVISLEYSDNNSWIDLTDTKIYLDWNQTDWDWVLAWTSCELDASWSATISWTKISLLPGSSMPFGKNTACVKITDLAWNQTITTWDFRVDNFTFKTEEITAWHFELFPEVDEELLETTKITYTTYWVGLDILWNFSVLGLDIDSVQIEKNEFFYDVRVVKNSVEEGSYNWYLDANNSSLVSIVKNNDIVNDSGLKTYEIYLKYKANVDFLQSAGFYSWNTKFSFIADY